MINLRHVGEKEFAKWHMRTLALIPWYVFGARRMALRQRCKLVAEKKAVLAMERFDRPRRILQQINWRK